MPDATFSKYYYFGGCNSNALCVINVMILVGIAEVAVEVLVVGGTTLCQGHHRSIAANAQWYEIRTALCWLKIVLVRR